MITTHKIIQVKLNYPKKEIYGKQKRGVCVEILRLKNQGFFKTIYYMPQR